MLLPQPKVKDFGCWLQTAISLSLYIIGYCNTVFSGRPMNCKWSKMLNAFWPTMAQNTSTFFFFHFKVDSALNLCLHRSGCLWFIVLCEAFCIFVLHHNFIYAWWYAQQLSFSKVMEMKCLLKAVMSRISEFSSRECLNKSTAELLMYLNYYLHCI